LITVGDDIFHRLLSTWKWTAAILNSKSNSKIINQKNEPMKCLMFDKNCDLLTCHTKHKCLWNDDFAKVATECKTKACTNTHVLSNFAARCLVLIGEGYNTFADGWSGAIDELQKVGMIRLERGADNVVHVSKIA
jgi:hypothetical protein